MSAAPSESRSRAASLDLARGLAVVLMVQQHLGTWFTDLRRLRGPALAFGVLVNELGGLAAPLFLLVSGAALGLSTMTPRAARLRGLALVALGTATNFLTPRWFGPTSFYVLHLLGVVAFLGPELARLPKKALLPLAGSLLLASALVQHALGVPLLLTNERMRGESLADVPLLALVGGHFPLLPWLAFPLVGLWAEREESFAVKRAVALGGAALSTVLLVARPLLSALLPRRLALRLTTFQFYPATLPLLFLVLGAGLLLLAVLRRREGKLRPEGFFGTLGRLSLTVFVVHVVVFREWVPRLFGDAKWEPALVLGMIALVLALFYFVGRAWRRIGYRGSLEWGLRVVGRLGGTPSRVPK